MAVTVHRGLGNHTIIQEGIYLALVKESSINIRWCDTPTRRLGLLSLSVFEVHHQNFPDFKIRDFPGHLLFLRGGTSCGVFLIKGVASQPGMPLPQDCAVLVCWSHKPWRMSVAITTRTVSSTFSSMVCWRVHFHHHLFVTIARQLCKKRCWQKLRAFAMQLVTLCGKRIDHDCRRRLEKHRHDLRISNSFLACNTSFWVVRFQQKNSGFVTIF